MRACSAFMVLLIVLPLAACGKPTPVTNTAAPSGAAPVSNEPAASEPAQATPAIAPTTSEIKKVDASGFTLGDYLPPLDGGRIEIATPDGWKPLPRDSKFVVRFSKLESGGGLPRMEIIVEENNLGGLSDVTEANVADFTAVVAKDLAANGTAVIEPPRPMLIGSVPCARYVSHLKLKIGEGTLLVERQTLALLRSGRLYKINLLVELNEVTASRDSAYAVCAGVRFPTAEPPVAPE